jgi:hypothetical protein
MKQQILREVMKVDENHSLHIQLPEGFANEVEVLILPLEQKDKNESVIDNMISAESMAIMRLTEETSFVKDVIGSEEEDCWNDL